MAQIAAGRSQFTVRVLPADDQPRMRGALRTLIAVTGGAAHIP